MRRALVLVLCAGGCFSDRGLALEVDVGGTGATSVELYVGNTACAAGNAAGIDCAGIAPPLPTNSTAPLVAHHLMGTVWFRSDPVPYVAAVRGGKATFRLEAPEPTELPIVIVIGLVGAERKGVATLRNVDVPVNTGKVMTTALTPADPIADSGTAVVAERVASWAEPAEPTSHGHSCVAVEHWSAGDVMRDFIVPPGDPDCDGFVGDPECDPAAYRSKSPPATSAPTCFTAVDAPACRLGTGSCTDGVGATHGCAPIGICAPDLFCECMGPIADPMCPPDKVALVPHVTCNVGVHAGEICKGDSGSVALASHYPEGDCGKPTLSALRLEDIASGDTSHMFDNAELEVARDGGTCNLRFKAKGGTHAPGTALGLIKLAAGDGALVLPLVVQFVPAPLACPATIDCTPPSDLPDGMWSCVTPATGRGRP